ncbi:MAG TPA: hydantoinase/oxoprolinase family protein [Anaerolineae bacterium]|nr:hydantoinase/oxoprolinase family protein [Anaerolineae bacterium]
MILGVDVGGTFTDFVLLDGAGQVSLHKLLTSARDPSLAILQGILDLEAGDDATVVHGATVATNALLERRGARTALVTTAGFSDVLEIGRQTRPELYALHPVRELPLVPAPWRFGLDERVDATGQVLVHLDPAQVDALVRRLLAEGIESIAISFLFSFLHPAHEQLVRARCIEIAGDSAPHISLSSDVLPEYREYERTSTTVVNAYVAPLMSRYLSNLEAGLAGRRLRIMQSNGGILSAAAARSHAARTALSGPAGGVVGAFAAAQAAGLANAITFDMGGTSTDVSLCPGYVQETTEGTIAGLPLRLPIIDIHTVGAGGGSIARLDAGGALRVGPQSAGSDPGPICYGRPEATEITVTDANLILGRLDANHFLGGRIKLDVERTRTSVQSLARRLSLPLEAAAWGVLRVANSNMERAIRTISVERGHDPRRFTLVAFGGAGPLHACELAEVLRIPRVLVPPHPGVLSALGMVLADVVKDYSRTVMLPAEAVAGEGALERLFLPLYEQARADLAAEGLSGEEIHLSPALDLRYKGQSFELTIPLHGPQPIADRFHDAHRRRFSYASESEPVEVVNLRLKAVGRTAKPEFTYVPEGDLNPRAAQIGYKQVYFAAEGSALGIRPVLAALYDRASLRPGNMVVGPAIIFQLDTTTVLPPGWSASTDGWGNLVARGGVREPA